jgi:hypothetical protein
VFDRVLRRIRRLVRAGRYVMTIHGHEEMEADGLILSDVERIVLTGKIVERQKDQRTGEAKYIVEGRSMRDEKAAVVTKVGPGGRLVIITVYVSTTGNEP